MMKRYTANGNIDKIVKTAKDYARTNRHEYITVEHLLLSLLNERQMYKALDAAGVHIDQLIDELDDYVVNNNILLLDDSEQPKKTHSLERVFNRAFTQVLFAGRQTISILDLMISISNESHSHAAWFLKRFGASKELIVENYTQKNNGNAKPVDDDEQIVEDLCTNLNVLAEDGKIDPVIGRQKEINDIAQVLARKTKSNVILVGDPGVGKTAIAEGLAVKLVKGEVPTFLKEWKIYSLNIGSLLAGTKYRGEFEERLVQLVTALSSMNKVILFIDEAHQMKGAGAGGGSSVDLANMLKPALSSGKLKVIASTTWEEFTKDFEKDRALMRRFNRIAVDEPSIADCKEILRGLKAIYEQHHNVVIDGDAIDAAVELSYRYQSDKKLPDKAIDLMDNACALKVSTDAEDRNINTDRIKEQLSKSTGIPVTQFGRKEEEAIDLPQIAEDIKMKVFGQDGAVDQILDRVWVSRAGLKSDNKPLGSFLMLGPTGTGKTELAKQLSANLSMKLIRFDMSEYMEKHSVSKMLGSPPGYVGYEDTNLQGGLLISAVNKDPHCILLFDEIEKAHPDAVQILLSIMDEGSVTGSNGKRADCRNAIVLLTSNLGAADAERNAIGFGDQQRTGDDDAAVKEFFRPEFRNRLDGIIKFGKLDKIVIRKIAAKFIADVNTQLIDKGITLVLDGTAWDYLIEKGYDDKMGARPMNRLIHGEIKVPLSKKILFDKLGSGVTITVRADEAGKKLEMVINGLNTGTDRSLFEPIQGMWQEDKI
jgi:ATP-dependent Clp protease ATP-binding subunit ClpA